MIHKGAKRPRVAALIVAASVAIGVAGYIGSAAGVPIIRSPLPAITVLPTMLLWIAVGEAPRFRWVVEFGLPVLVGPFVLLAWYPRLLKGAADVPNRSMIGLVVLSVLTVAHFYMGWDYGLRYQGQRYVRALAVLNAATLVAAWALLISARRRRLFEFTLGAHALVVAWLVWIAFPWLGELP